MPELEAFVNIAVRLAIGTDFDTPNGMVCVNRHWKISGDFQTSIADVIFRKYLASLKSKGELPPNFNVKKSSGNKVAFPPFVCNTTSEYGVKREITYLSARDVANGIISNLPEEFYNICSSVNIVSREGCISISTKQHMEWHLVMGRLPCKICGGYFKGVRGLRMHQILVHKVVYAEAQKDALLSESQVDDLTCNIISLYIS
jgi:hypothetical protein